MLAHLELEHRVADGRHATLHIGPQPTVLGREHANQLGIVGLLLLVRRGLVKVCLHLGRQIRLRELRDAVLLAKGCAGNNTENKKQNYVFESHTDIFF